MSELYEKSTAKLELGEVLEKLAGCACSEAAKAACLYLRPNSDLEDVKELLAQTTAACNLVAVKGTPSFQDVKEVGAALERADRGGSLSTVELLRIAGVLRCARSIKSYCEPEERPAVLAPLFAELTPNRRLEDRIFTSILSEEEIADAASSTLADIRRHMRQQSAKIRDGLQKIISSPSYAKYLRDPIITIRQDRYVVPVKSEFKNEVPGLVHDVSATGSTFFVEPMSAVNANNALRELQLKEKKEIERILAELSAEAAALREIISQDYAVLTRLDVIFAKARLSYEMRAGEPLMNNEGKIELKKARHPLIDPKKVVPISLRLGTDFDSMIITGPNTGGKTVTLKTIGLLTLMAECGLHVPAGDGSCLSTFDLVLADIGDEQSIQQSLSTFSSHMRTIVDVVAQCDSRSLVLFDELGAGTDPAEGAALAIALIEFCRKMGSRVAATTHYAELKLYAMRTKGVINASCEFDVETLQPTYRLLIGIPGKSNAFAISRKLGLSEDILKAAGDLVSKSDKDFEDVLGQLEQQRQQMEAARAEAERLQFETEQIKRQSEEFNAQIKKERDKALEKARKEARQIIDDARYTANQVSEELKQLRKQMKESADMQGVNQKQSELRGKLNEAESRFAAQQQPKERPKPAREIMLGDTVEIIKLETKASVIGINKDGSYQLRAGILQLTAKPEEVYLLENVSEEQKKKAHPAHSGREMRAAAMSSEIDLRGMDAVEAICVLDRFLDDAMRANLASVRIIHGKGTGTLRAAVQNQLKRNKYIKKYRLGTYGEGENGVTIAEFS
jgi:DNA mismatch repair protein MutS2